MWDKMWCLLGSLLAAHRQSAFPRTVYSIFFSNSATCCHSTAIFPLFSQCFPSRLSVFLLPAFVKSPPEWRGWEVKKLTIESIFRFEGPPYRRLASSSGSPSIPIHGAGGAIIPPRQSGQSLHNLVYGSWFTEVWIGGCISFSSSRIKLMTGQTSSADARSMWKALFNLVAASKAVLSIIKPLYAIPSRRETPRRSPPWKTGDPVPESRCAWCPNSARGSWLERIIRSWRWSQLN